VWISALQVIAMLNWSTDLFLIQIFLGSAAVSDYSIYSKFCAIPITLISIAGPAIQLATVKATLDVKKIKKLIFFSWPAIILLSLVLTFFARELFRALPLLAVWTGLSATPATAVIVSFSMLTVLSSLAAIYAPIANGLSLFRFQFICSAIFAPLNLLLSWFLATQARLGFSGIILATVIAMAVTSCSLVPMAILSRIKS
jgi:O-antigen/teichoic acid export membrane protein